VELRRIFKIFDEDDTGKITLDNLRQVAADLKLTVSEKDLEAMIKQADLNEDGEVDIEEFIAVMKKAKVIPS
jgi:centrin-3